ncbi:helix-turn-helix domain-containing protein [Agarivorans sp. QJM3NY_29]|uniref:helix-turn-helix domain-containing protein n=1 Tax=unclassified Agarivorans TaxID=2636026 RepID=UPI003D7CEB04
MNRNDPPIAQIAATLNSERRRSGLSIAEVARQAKIAKSTLSQLENGFGNPSIETLWSICNVLGIPVSHLLESPRQKTKIIRYGEGATVVSKRKNYQATLLAACPPNVSRDIYWIEVEPGEPHYSEPHNQGVIEHVVITKGKAQLGLVSESYELNEGDYISYPGDLPHLFEALQEGTRAMLISEHR